MSKKDVKITIGNKTTTHTIKSRKDFAPSIKIVESKKVYKRKDKYNKIND